MSDHLSGCAELKIVSFFWSLFRQRAGSNGRIARVEGPGKQCIDFPELDREGEVKKQMRFESVIETRMLLSPVSIERDRGGESLEELRAIIRRSTFLPEARIVATINHYMKKYKMSEAEAIGRILQEREQGR